jgi:alpha-glucoside transport system substrate-binding protein
MFKRISWISIVVLVVASMLLVSCDAATPTPTEEPMEEPTDEPVEERPLEGETVSVIAVWGGDEQESFMAMIAPWEERTGATVEYEGTRDLNAVLTTRVEGGNPPDIAGLPGPGVLQQYAQDGYLVDLSAFMDMGQLSQAYDQSWLDLATYEGGLYGLFTKVAVKSLVWYSPPAFEEAGYETPGSWDEMIALSDQIVEDGTSPWCIGLESGSASGWPGTDWIEDIMLRTAGPEVYDQWRTHEIPWTDPAVKNAWETWGAIVANEDYVNGGTTGVLATNFGESPYPMFQDPPGCYMHRQASFIQGFITDQFPELEAVDDYNYFGFPSIDERYGTPALTAGDLFGMFTDTPAARSLMEWLASAEAQTIWAERGGFLSPNKNVSPDIYPDPLIAQAAEILVDAEVVRFDASDLMPQSVNDAFWQGVLNYVENPDDLDTILQDIEAVAAEAYE